MATIERLMYALSAPPGGATTVRLVLELDVLGQRELPDGEGGVLVEDYGNYLAARVDCDPGCEGFVCAWLSDLDSNPRVRLFDLLPEITDLHGLSGTIARTVFTPPILDDLTHDPRIEWNVAWFSEVRHTDLQQARAQLTLPKLANPAQFRAWGEGSTRTRTAAEQAAVRRKH